MPSEASIPSVVDPIGGTGETRTHIDADFQSAAWSTRLPFHEIGIDRNRTGFTTVTGWRLSKWLRSLGRGWENRTPLAVGFGDRPVYPAHPLRSPEAGVEPATHNFKGCCSAIELLRYGWGGRG